MWRSLEVLLFVEFPGSTLDCNTPLRYTHFVAILSDSALDISPSSSSYTSLLYKGLKGKARIPTDDLIPKIRRDRNQHSLAFQIPQPVKMSICLASSPRLSGTGMISLSP